MSFEEKNNHETSNDDTPIDPTFLAQVTRKCAHYRSAATAEKVKKEEALLELDADTIKKLEQTKREHNEENFPSTVTSSDVSSDHPVTVFDTANSN